MTIGTAFEFAFVAHRNQVDKGGAPYLLHVLRVALQMKSDEDFIVALLHDVVEDGNITLRDLNLEGELHDAVDALTRRPLENYDQYIDRVAANPIAVRVKLADLKDNSDISRIQNPTLYDMARWRKYQAAIVRLGAA